MILYILIFLCLGAFLYNYFQISVYKLNKIKIKSEKVKENIKIVQITDFHNNKYVDVAEIVKDIIKINPDIIVLTGDIIDKRTKVFELDYSLSFLQKLKKVCKNVFFVCGNHELNNPNNFKFIEKLKLEKIAILDNSREIFEINDTNVIIIGVNFQNSVDEYKESIKNIDKNSLVILLSHSPSNPIKCMEYNKNIDIILCGHTHGGQIRVPVLGSIVAARGEFLNIYDKGIYRFEESTLYIDSGLGNSGLPLRTLNQIQFSVIEIERI